MFALICLETMNSYRFSNISAAMLYFFKFVKVFKIWKVPLVSNMFQIVFRSCSPTKKLKNPTFVVRLLASCVSVIFDT